MRFCRNGDDSFHVINSRNLSRFSFHILPADTRDQGMPHEWRRAAVWDSEWLDFNFTTIYQHLMFGLCIVDVIGTWIINHMQMFLFICSTEVNKTSAVTIRSRCVLSVKWRRALPLCQPTRRNLKKSVLLLLDCSKWRWVWNSAALGPMASIAHLVRRRMCHPRHYKEMSVQRGTPDRPIWTGGSYTGGCEENGLPGCDAA
jgi:hypothetical protein